MTIHLLSSIAAGSSVTEQLGLGASDTFEATATWYAHFMRRVCSTTCPIPRGKLIRLAKDLLSGLLADPDIVQSNIEAAIDGLFESGDLLELSKFSSSDEHYSGDWIFLAPPSYMQHGNGRVYVFGIAADDAPFLPLSLSSSLVFDGPYRHLPISDRETLEALFSAGLRQVPDAHWQITPKKQTARQFFDYAVRKLAVAPPAGAMEGIRIFLPNAQSGEKYKDRLKYPKQETGLFVGRRPASFGAEHWCFFELEQGTAVRFIDLPLAGDKLRGCDAAWHLQLAIDSLKGTPAVYKIKEIEGKVEVYFSFPLPLWALRRFRALDNHSNTSPFHRTFSVQEWPTEKRFIEEQLWFALINNTK